MTLVLAELADGPSGDGTPSPGDGRHELRRCRIAIALAVSVGIFVLQQAFAATPYCCDVKFVIGRNAFGHTQR